jgi:RNA polymerase sigma-70 factor, ECF subfamily
LSELVEPDLVGRAAGGNEAAFAALVRAHYDGIYRMAWRWLGCREDAEDVAQEVCIKLARAIHSFRGDSEFSTWLYRLTYNATLDFMRARKRSRRNQEPEVVALFKDRTGESPDASVLGAELWEEVRSLPEQQRDAVLLVYAEDMTHAEAAEIMECSEKTVSWHLHEARKRLKTRLQVVG